MTAVTAAVAGVEDIIILSPKIGPELALAAQLAGAKRVALLGGAHGVAALALGTETFPKVDMIVGPGNAYVTEAKRQLQGIIGIDMLAGPSEVAIIADDSANVDWAAMDLLAQAEHDPDARAYLLTNSVSLAETVQQRLPQLAEQYNLPDFVMAALSQSGVLVLETLDDCVEASNQIAPEHLELLVKHPATITEGLTDYGALFIGHGTPVPMGDYVCGPNHTLPTARSARFSGGLNPMVFLRPQTWMTINPVDDNPDAVNEIYDDAATFAGVEGLVAHRESATLRRL
jgi:histidinol dehydrogenase